MVKTARELWLQLNENKFECTACNYSGHNGAHWKRHIESTKHFLLHDFGLFAPMDVKVVVASFLPLGTIVTLDDKIAWATLKRLYPTREIFKPSTNLLSRSAFLGGRKSRNSQTQAFVL